MNCNDNFWTKKRCILSPSLICLDHSRFAQQIQAIEKAGIQALHVDILDGHFSPSLPLGLETVRAIKEISSLRLDAHVMAVNNDYFIDELLDIGVEQLVFHIETEAHVDQQLKRIRKAGVRAGVALKPATPLSVLDYAIERCDLVMLMLINPGYAGDPSEKQVPYARRKVRDLRAMIRQRGLNVCIEVDGRISREDISALGGSGDADIFVAGSTCIDKNKLEGSLTDLVAFRDELVEKTKER